MPGAVTITDTDASEKRWAIYVDKHVIPIGDRYEHQRTPMCPCHPRVVTEPNGSFIFVHDAADARE